MHALKILDPEGVALRSQHCLTRRQYHNKGPNFLIHIDGYDKLKPFVFFYSRSNMWVSIFTKSVI